MAGRALYQEAVALVEVNAETGTVHVTFDNLFEPRVQQRQREAVAGAVDVALEGDQLIVRNHPWLSMHVKILVQARECTAQLRVSQDGLTLSDVSEIRSNTFAPDVVVAQAPPARTAGTAVALLVNRGERGASYVMPDLIGVNGDRAADLLRNRGFRVAVVGTLPYPGVAAGVVIRQSPQAGFQIGPGEPVSLEVSR